MKHFTQNLRWLFMSLLLVVGVGSAWGQSTEVYSADFTSVATHSYTQNKTFTLSDKSWTSSVSQVNGGVFYLGCNSNNASKGVLGNNSTFSDISTALAAIDSKYTSGTQAYALRFDNAYNNVTEVEFAWNGGNNAFQVYLFGDSGSGFTLLGSTNYASSGSSVPGSVSWEGNATNYTKFAIVARPGTPTSNATNKTLRAATFKIYQSNGSTPTLTDPEFAWSASTATYTSGQAFTAPTLSYVSGYDGTVLYSSSDPTVATVNGNGVITPIKAGSTEISAYAEATNTYEAVTLGDVAYTLTVVGPAAPTISPADGTTFSGSQSVTITGASGNTIYYTTDGTDPTTNSSQYSSAFTVSGNVTVKAIQVGNDGIVSSVASATYTDSSVQTTEITAQWVASEQGYLNQEEVTSSIINSDLTVSFDKGTNSNTPKYFTTGTSVRVYGGGSFTIQGGTDVTIKSITITFGSGDGSNTITTDVGSYNNGSWTGSASSVTFTIGGATGNRRIAAIDVTYETTGGSGLTAPNLKFSGSASYNMTMEVGDVTSANFTKDTDATVTFTFNPTGVATYDTTTGNLTAVAEGTTTLTAEAAANSTYDAGTATLNITVNKKAAGLAYDPTSATVTIGDTFTQPTFSNPNNLTVTFASDQPTVASIDSSTGVITVGSVAGTAVITASFAGDGTYNAQDVTFTLRVLEQASGSDTYTKVTSTNDLEVGEEYLIVYEESEVALGAISTTNTKYGTSESVTISNNTITITNEPVAVLTLGVGNNGENYSFLSSLDNKYLYWGSGNTLNSNATLSDNTSWTLTFDNDNLVMTNVVKDSGDDRVLRYNSTSGQERFACYKGTQQAIQLYKKASSTPAAPYVRFADISKAVEYEANLVVTPQTAETNVTVTYASSNTSVATVNATTGAVTILAIGDTEISATSTEDATLTALYYLHVTEPNIQLFTRVDDPDEFVEGGEYLLVQQVNTGTTTANAYNGQKGTYNYSDVQQVTIQDDMVIDNSVTQAHVLTLERAGEDMWYIKDKNSDKYLYWSSGNNLYFSDTNAGTNAYKWILSVYPGVQYCQNASDTERYLRYNSNNGQERFACYTSNMTQIVFYKKATALADAGLSFDTPSYNITLGNTFTSQMVNNPNNATPVKYFSNNTGTAEVDVWTGQVTIKRAGTVKITATHYGSYQYRKSQASYIINVKKAVNEGLLFNETFDKLTSTGGTDGEYLGTVTTGYTRADGWDGNKPNGDSWESTWETDEEWTTFDTSDTPSSASTSSYVQAAAECVKFGGGNAGQGSKANGKLVTREINFNGATEGTLTFSAAGWGTDWNSQTTSGGAAIMNPNTLTVTATNCTLTLQSHTGGSTISGNTITLVNGEWDDFTYAITNISGNVVITFEGYRGFLDDIAVGGPYSVTIGSTGYATLYYGTAPLVVPAGVTAYTMHLTTNTNGYKDVVKGVTLTEGAKLAPGTAVILQGDAGTYNFPFAFETVANNDPDNVLMGSDAATTFNDPAYEYFVLGKKEGVVGFYHQAPSYGKYVNNGAHKCFLQIPWGESILNDTSSSAKGFSLVDILTTGIENVAVESKQMNDNVYYNLSGQRVATPTKGIYIVNGKKVFVK